MSRVGRQIGVGFALALGLGWGARGAPAPDEGYELVRGAAPAVKANKAAAVSLSIVPRAGYRLLDGGPVLVRVTGAALKPARALLRREDAVDPHADVPRFELAFTAPAAGPARLDAACTFYVCKAQRCRAIETTVSWDLAVAP